MNPLNLQPREGFSSRRPITFLLSFALAGGCLVQAQTNLPNAPAPQPDVSLKTLPLNVVRDQKAIWTSPARIRIKDLNWLVPLGAVTGFAIATDRDAMVHVVSNDAQFNKHNVDASNVLTGGLIAAPIGLLGWGAEAQLACARGRFAGGRSNGRWRRGRTGNEAHVLARAAQRG